MKNLIKIAIGLVIGVALATAGTTYFLNKKYTSELESIQNSYAIQLGDLQSEYDSIKTHADSVDVVLAYYEAQIDSLELVDIKHQSEIDRLETELKKALNDLFDNVTDKTKYMYLQQRYPTVDTLKYPFSGGQVSDILVDLIEGDYKDSILLQRNKQQRALRAELLNSGKIIDVLNGERNDLQLLTDDLYRQLAIKTEENKLTEEEMAKLEDALRKWKLGALGAGTGLLLLLLLL